MLPLKTVEWPRKGRLCGGVGKDRRRGGQWQDGEQQFC